MRKIVVDNEEWQWRVGKSNVLIRKGDIKVIRSCWELCGMTRQEWAQAKDSWGHSIVSIVPSMIEQAIREYKGS